MIKRALVSSLIASTLFEDDRIKRRLDRKGNRNERQAKARPRSWNPYNERQT